MLEHQLKNLLLHLHANTVAHARKLVATQLIRGLIVIIKHAIVKQVILSTEKSDLCEEKATLRVH